MLNADLAVTLVVVTYDHDLATAICAHRGSLSALALLAVVIGTFVLTLNSGHMAQGESLELFAGLGVDTLQIQAAPVGKRSPVLSFATIDALPHAAPEVKEAVPQSSRKLAVRAVEIARDKLAAGRASDFEVLTLAEIHAGLRRGETVVWASTAHTPAEGAS